MSHRNDLMHCGGFVIIKMRKIYLFPSINIMIKKTAKKSVYTEGVSPPID
jgi:hypothetical protein